MKRSFRKIKTTLGDAIIPENLSPFEAAKIIVEVFYMQPFSSGVMALKWAREFMLQ